MLNNCRAKLFMSETIVFIFLFIFGSIIGSFLNVCIVRIPEKISIVLPASHCPRCKNPIPWYDNIPLLSYIILGGRCRHCTAPIAFRYFIVELLTPAVLLMLYAAFGLSLSLLTAFIFSASLIVITFIDLKHQVIPDVISLPGIPVCFACSFVAPWTDPLQSLIGICVGGGILYLFAAGYQLLTGKEGMGGGDIKMLAMIGAFLGWKGALATLILGAFAGSVVGIILIMVKGKNLKYAVPFGPFLAAGAFCALLFGEQLIRFYLALGR
jgi:leader peptidase (prepilin peptidase) / N-methyltransferase